VLAVAPRHPKGLPLPLVRRGRSFTSIITRVIIEVPQYISFSLLLLCFNRFSELAATRLR